MCNRQSCLCLLALLLSLGGGARQAAKADTDAQAAPIVVHARLDDQVISPVTARFLKRALREAQQLEAECLVIELNTPGGLLASTQEMVTTILASEVPVVVYVSPAGGRAASAGLFITLASHIAAMAPGTHIGAAHPVSLPGFLPTSPPSSPKPSGGESEEDERDVPSVMEQKVISDTRAWVRSLAKLRGRDAAWAELAVTESRAIIASEALEQGVIDLIASDVDDLLAQIDGREVEVPRRTVRLRTSDADIRTFEMWWGESVLAVIANPTVAYLLLILGFYGILFEIYTPGWGVGGTLGVLCLLVGFFALAILPVNYAGLALILLAMGLFIAEAFVASFGLLTLGGCVCLILGGLMLIDSPAGFTRISWTVVVPVALATALITLFLVTRVISAHRRQVQTGSEGMLGQRAITKEPFRGGEGEYRGTVFLHGEYWQAVCTTPLDSDQQVDVTNREGLTLTVRPSESAP
jgi:membrane-bound serine protease (ClpP class)